MMNGDDPQNDDLGALVRIARSLGVPVATFLATSAPETPQTETPVVGVDHLPEVVMLLRLFVRLKSPESRARCLAYLVQEATHDG